MVTVEILNINNKFKSLNKGGGVRRRQLGKNEYFSQTGARTNKYVVRIKITYDDENFSEEKTFEVTAACEVEAYRMARNEKEKIECNIVTDRG